MLNFSILILFIQTQLLLLMLSRHSTNSDIFRFGQTFSRNIKQFVLQNDRKYYLYLAKSKRKLTQIIQIFQIPNREKQMSKQNIKRFPSLRNNLPLAERRQSKEDQIPQRMSKTGESQSDLAKKIQNKLKMRKRSFNTNSINHVDNTQQSSQLNFGSGRESSKLNFFDENINIVEQIDKIWDSDAEIIEKTMSPFINRNNLKQMILKDQNLILCYLGKGQKLNDILIKRGEKIIKAQIQKRKIQQKERHILTTLDNRIKKLGAV